MKNQILSTRINKKSNKKNKNKYTNNIKQKGGFFMEDKQKINCTVESCVYNNLNNHKCTLKEIQVTPIAGCNTKEPDESMCSSYKFEN